MSDWIDYSFEKIGITGYSSHALQFLIGLGLVAITLTYYEEPTPVFLVVIGILLGAYLMIKSLQ